MLIKVESKKVNKFLFNVQINLSNLWDCGFGILSYDFNKKYFYKTISGTEGKKQYDNTYTFTIYATSNETYTNYIQVQVWWGNANVTINYMRIFYKESYNIFDFLEYKKASSK